MRGFCKEEYRTAEHQTAEYRTAEHRTPNFEGTTDLSVEKVPL